MSSDFTPFSALIGGALLGLSASLMLLFNGRVTGISGIVGGLIRPKAGEFLWRFIFVAGLIITGAIAVQWSPESVSWNVARSPVAIAVAGLLVGFGTQLGNGCTSGHGVCGLSRRSPRSLASVTTFMGFGALTASTITYFLGGIL